MKTDLQRIDTTRIPERRAGDVLKNQMTPGCLDIGDVLDSARGTYITSERWQRANYYLRYPIPEPDHAPLRQASSQMQKDDMLYCSGCKGYHPKSEFSRVKLAKGHENSTGYSRTALQKRGYRYWCKDYEARERMARYYGRLGDKAQRIAG